MRIIDIDGHVREADDLFEKYLGSAVSRPRAARSKKSPTANCYFAWKAIAITANPDERPFRIKDDGSPVNEIATWRPILNSASQAMDRDRIERGLLFPSAGLYFTSVQEEAYAAALCRAYNNWLYDYCARGSQRA